MYSMSNLIKRIDKALACPPFRGNSTMLASMLEQSKEEIERLKSKLTQAQQAEQGAVLEIEHLQGEIEDRNVTIECLLSMDGRAEIERLKSAAKNYAAAAIQKQQENTRLRSALERIEIETSDEYAREIAREARRND